jgi:hypothetical protein
MATHRRARVLGVRILGLPTLDRVSALLSLFIETLSEIYSLLSRQEERWLSHCIPETRAQIGSTGPGFQEPLNKLYYTASQRWE